MTVRTKLIRVGLWSIAGCIGLFVLLYIAVAIAMAVWFDPLKFSHGELASEARLVIQLPEQQSLIQLHPRFVEAAQLGRFVHTYESPGTCTSEELRSKTDCVVVASSTWFESEYDPMKTQRSLMFLFDYEFEGEFDASTAFGSSFTLVLRKGSTESLEIEDWETYFDYQDNILPAVFPGADISVHETRHPAVFTDDDILRQIQRERDFEIPERYLPAPEAP